MSNEAERVLITPIFRGFCRQNKPRFCRQYKTCAQEKANIFESTFSHAASTPMRSAKKTTPECVHTFKILCSACPSNAVKTPTIHLLQIVQRRLQEPGLLQDPLALFVLHYAGHGIQAKGGQIVNSGVTSKAITSTAVDLLWSVRIRLQVPGLLQDSPALFVLHYAGHGIQTKEEQALLFPHMYI